MIKVIRDVKGRKLDKNVSKARQVQKPNSYPAPAACGVGVSLFRVPHEEVYLNLQLTLPSVP